MKYPKSTFSYPCFQADLFKELIKVFKVKGLDDKYMEYKLVGIEGDIGSDDDDHSNVGDT